MFFKPLLAPLFIGPLFKAPGSDKACVIGSLFIASRTSASRRIAYVTSAAPIVVPADLRAANDPGRVLAHWRRNAVTGRLECRWRVARADDAGIGEEPPPVARADPAFAVAVSGFVRGAVRSGRTEVRHAVHLPSPPALPAGRRADPRARLAQSS
ncbi:hypothetical protein [Lysobacter sp. CA199]|uniref:hypothetical protein n=1 Tax=Lysobacter sp. CA199 TaxID=3455608 RepID=UPI003F8D2800